MNVMLEGELDTAWWSSLEATYELTGQRLYSYLVLRSFVDFVKEARVSKPTSEMIVNQLTHFLINEQNISKEDTVIFHNTCISKELQQMVRSIVSNWHSHYTFLSIKNDLEHELINRWSMLNKSIKQKARKHRGQPFYELLMKQMYLSILNDTYEISNQYEMTPISELILEKAFPIRLELKLERYLHAYMSSHQDVALLLEKNIEDYLVKHLDEVEKGLVFLGRQVIVNKGRIDVLAKDYQGHMVIIEVKVTADTDVLWQHVYYSEEIKKMYGGDVRFILVAPKWEPHIMNELLKNPRAEVKLFTPHVKDKKIQTLTIRDSIAS